MLGIYFYSFSDASILNCMQNLLYSLVKCSDHKPFYVNILYYHNQCFPAEHIAKSLFKISGMFIHKSLDMIYIKTLCCYIIITDYISAVVRRSYNDSFCVRHLHCIRTSNLFIVIPPTQAVNSQQWVTDVRRNFEPIGLSSGYFLVSILSIS